MKNLLINPVFNSVLEEAFFNLAEKHHLIDGLIKEVNEAIEKQKKLGYEGQIILKAALENAPAYSYPFFIFYLSNPYGYNRFSEITPYSEVNKKFVDYSYSKERNQDGQDMWRIYEELFVKPEEEKKRLAELEKEKRKMEVEKEKKLLPQKIDAFISENGSELLKLRKKYGFEYLYLIDEEAAKLLLKGEVFEGMTIPSEGYYDAMKVEERPALEELRLIDEIKTKYPFVDTVKIEYVEEYSEYKAGRFLTVSVTPFTGNKVVFYKEV